MERKQGVGGSEINRGLASFHGYSKNFCSNLQVLIKLSKPRKALTSEYIYVIYNDYVFVLCQQCKRTLSKGIRGCEGSASGCLTNVICRANIYFT